jgi:2,5-diamino-6-(ribosylamino)-4(3H)-pyrimidinone 5'-phosphate reductase
MVNSSRPETTLFMLMSIDGKITSGKSDILDPDKDWKNIKGVKEGLFQYYEIEQTTDLVSMNSGRVMAKIGINEKKEPPSKSPVTFVIIDRKPHLDQNGVKYLCNWLKKLIVVTNNRNHSAFLLKSSFSNLEIIEYKDNLDLIDLFNKLKFDFQINKMTIQTGGTLNSIFLRMGLIDHLKIVIAPLIVGGKNTSTLVDGESFSRIEELNGLIPMNLKKIETLKNSYILLEYDLFKK